MRTTFPTTTIGGRRHGETASSDSQKFQSPNFRIHKPLKSLTRAGKKLGKICLRLFCHQQYQRLGEGRWAPFRNLGRRDPRFQILLLSPRAA